ncbi:hypothetical protein ASG25_04600 [Rhizobium sp. Leaf384]|uniref:ATPase inhibitor subunit zeta n=1 Tax=unclassified Rhizobium TaxID=2613769 RepID=UPI00071546EF|nr:MULTISPECIES: ATPase inhibitor subunit zeta [unclassified Rhizobium]KQS77258.1 hypothetical protein ASG58_09650 [Rhizobium sp. Leaf383]KQS80819.1 hypothetical protein ASG25_04600 [Rhizobium sp. Leaf384]
MTPLRKIAQAEETRFVRGEELTFRAEARRNALIGLWAAAMLDSPDRETYARDIMAVGVEHPNGVMDRLNADFDAAGVIFLEDDIRERMAAMLRSLKDEMSAG